MFAILYGRSDCGKSSLTNTLMTSMFGYGKKGFVPNNLFTPSRVRGLRQEFRRHPVVFDDVSNNRFRQYADEVVKDGEISHGDEYPCIALLMNMDTRRFKAEIIKRSMMIYTQTSLPGNRPAARGRLQASVSRIQDTLTTSFYRQYLKDMSTILETMPEESYRSVDVLHISSTLLCRLFERSLPEGELAPVWLEPVTLSGVPIRPHTPMCPNRIHSPTKSRQESTYSSAVNDQSVSCLDTGPIKLDKIESLGVAVCSSSKLYIRPASPNG